MSTTEQKKVLAALETSMRIEIDGKAFYLKASGESTNDAGRRLLSRLASEEDAHLALFVKIYESMRQDKSWPETEIQPSSAVKTLFSPDASKASLPRQAPSNEIEAIKTAVGMEIKSFNFYEDQIKTAFSDAESQFFTALAEQEHGHQLILLDYLEFLQDSASYFVRTERHSLDGA